MTKVSEVGGAQHKAATGGASAQQITAAFDKAFPWSTETHALNGNNSDIKLPGAISADQLKGTARTMFATVQKAKSYASLTAYSLKLGGQTVLAILGRNDSDAGLALFDARGKQLAFKDVMGLNQWQLDAKGNARNMALGAGLPGAPRVKPEKPLSPAAAKLTSELDKAYPFSDGPNYGVNIPSKLQVSLPTYLRGTPMARMLHSQVYDGGANTQAYKLDLGGKHVFCVIGQSDAIYDIGLFDLKGNRVAFNGGSGWTV